MGDPILSVLSPIQSPTKPSLRSLEFQLGSSSTADPIIPPPTEIVIVISGPSGVCIDAVINKLRQVREEVRHLKNFDYVVVNCLFLVVDTPRMRWGL
ncbi:predicted protein [Arabidopsis lyrata subsp. lyrata]|uniref:Predicted protein n=1 Tax=Arabidopsis lyrata subsp. lyrata TaxID=81972 RepID=D7LRX4_ARALL|nr:predicted protein [Arabidopsis lyrata subsp. lyrata]